MGDCILRHRHGHSSIEAEIGKFIFSQLLASKHKRGWRIGNDISQCNLCGRCEMICPSDAIRVSRHNGTWTLNNGRCSKCLSCIIKCPAHSLTQVRL